MPVRAFIDNELASTLSHPLVASADIARRTHTRQDGYLRLRCTLINGDFLEIALHVVAQANEASIDSYRYQWMDATQTVLRRRWDNSPHFPNLPGYPHHCHVGDEATVEPAQPMDLAGLLEIISRRLD